MITRATRVGIVGLGLWALVDVASSSPQKTFPQPAADKGPVPIEGQVSVVNTPTVRAVQDGEWRVALTNQPEVLMAAPPFLVAGRTYAVRWSPELTETYRILSVGSGWALGERSEVDGGGQHWVNPSRAMTIRQVGH